MDGFTIAYLGLLVAYAGDWERGCALSERARSLNPHHTGWYWFTPLLDAYRTRATAAARWRSRQKQYARLLAHAGR